MNGGKADDKLNANTKESSQHKYQISIGPQHESTKTLIERNANDEVARTDEIVGLCE